MNESVRAIQIHPYNIHQSLIYVVLRGVPFLLGFLHSTDIWVQWWVHFEQFYLWILRILSLKYLPLSLVSHLFMS